MCCIQFYVSLYSLLPAYPSLGGCSAACGCARFCCMPLIHPDLITPAFATCMSFSPKVLGRPLPRSLPLAETLSDARPPLAALASSCCKPFTRRVLRHDISSVLIALLLPECLLVGKCSARPSLGGCSPAFAACPSLGLDCACFYCLRVL